MIHLTHRLAYSLANPHHLTERLTVLCLALVVDAIFGEMPWLYRFVPHPVVVMGKAVAFMEQKLNRASRGAMDRRIRGILTLIFLATAAVAVGGAFSLLATYFRFGWLIEVFLAGTLLAQRSLYDHVAGVGRALDAGGVAAGRQAVSMIVGRDPATLDEHGVLRAAVESLAENFSDGVVAPALAYAALGLPGIFLYKMANTLDSMIGHRSARYRHFGWASARFDDLLNLIPARLSGLLICLAAVFVPGGHPAAALRIMLRDARKHRSPNAGWPEAAMAGALNVALSGPRRYGKVIADDPWLGSGSAQLVSRDLSRALMIFVIACVLSLGIAAIAVALAIRH